MKKIKVEDAIGNVLCHDFTRIVKDGFKGVQFKKGHIVREEDIPVLLSMGKEHIYVWEKQEGILHEDEAAELLYKLCFNDNMERTDVKEGKIELYSSVDGLLKIDIEKLYQINMLDEIIIATRHGNTWVKKGDKIAGTRVIPLLIEEEKLKKAQEITNGKPIMEIKPFKGMKAGLITTGSEVYKGRIKDTFSPVVINKLKNYNIDVTEHVIVDDDISNISNAILEMKNRSVNMIVCTGGMSVDPDDMTPGAIKKSGVNIITYGAPVLPGAMFLVGYFEDGTPIVGLPGCVMYSKATAFDLVLPKLATGENITKEELARLGNGGLCLGCDVCQFPNCGFGKGN